MELQRNTHRVFRIMCHFVWIQYRHKVFSKLCHTNMKNVIEQIGYDYDIEIVELEILAEASVRAKMPSPANF